MTTACASSDVLDREGYEGSWGAAVVVKITLFEAAEILGRRYFTCSSLLFAKVLCKQGLDQPYRRYL